MATNPYFNNFKDRNEQSLIEDLTIEAIKFYGMDVVYLPRTLVNKDKLFGEDPISRFSDNKPIEMYLESVNGYGDGDLLSKFGLQIKDSASLVVSKLRFLKETGMLRPLEGDIIYLPLTQSFFEIKFVEHENPFYQVGKAYTFKLSVELFQFSEETFSTGDSEIDSIIDNKEYNIILTITGGVGTFAAGDPVYQFSNGTITGSYASADANGTVKSLSGSNTLILESTKGNWQSSSTVTRYVTSNDNTKYKIVSGNDDTTGANNYNDNNNIETLSDTNLDFTITNPFGEP